MSDNKVVTLRGLVRKNSRAMALSGLLLSIYHVAEAMIAVLLGWLAHSLIASDNVWHLVGGIAALGATLATVSVSWQTGFRMLQATSARNVCELRAGITSQVVSHGGHPDDSNSLPRQELPTVVGEDVVQAVDIIEVVPVGVSALVGAIFCTIVLALIDLPLGVVVLVLSAVVLMVLHRLSQIIEQRAEKQQTLLARVTASMTDILQGLPVISGVAGAHPAYRGYARKSEQACVDARKLAWVSGGYEAVAMGSNVLLLSAVGLYAGYRTMSGDVTLGELVTVVALSQFIAEPMRQCSRMPRFIGLARASVRRLQRVAEAQPLRKGQGVPLAQVGKPAIIVRGGDGEAEGSELAPVAFAEGRLTVVHCSTAWADALVDALVAGESMELGPLTDSQPQSLRIRGRDICEISVDDVRSAVLAEPRKPALFGDTMGQAVLRSSGEGRAKDAVDIFNALGLDELAPGAAHSAGVLDHELTEGARNLSGGQRQRLGLARALLAEPEMLVMVDPVSSVDSMTGMKVARAVRDIRRGRTTVVLCVGRAFRSVAEDVVDVKPLAGSLRTRGE
ncbi:ABC transporter ATP-binding protein [uncultured Corynebacterium sp.]|uniref:ABC transporter transmembrane domain-containing protein n=1 Tax=uncultured Corynebacterium sp. TaxID=159447 RepID=UPI00259ABBD1|nr:ABC transporter ATP-binding protein [uncultured Corynebacterium sp.]